MSVEVKISPTFTRYTNNEKIAKVNGTTVGECLNQLVDKFPDLKPALFEQSGRLHRYIDIYVNQETAYPEELDKPVKNGDKLHLLMLIAGG